MGVPAPAIYEQIRKVCQDYIANGGYTVDVHMALDKVSNEIEATRRFEQSIVTREQSGGSRVG